MASFLDFFDDGGFTPDPSRGMAGMMSPTDKLMALSQGISRLGLGLSQPGSTGQRLAQGFSGLGQGMTEGNRSALQNRMITQKLAEDEKRRVARERLGLLAKGRTNGMRVPGLGQDASDGATGGTAFAGMADNPMFGAIMDAYPEAGAKLVMDRMMPKERSPTVVAPGSTVLGADGKPIYTAPDRTHMPKAGDVRKYTKGDQEISEEFDPQSMTWKQIGAGTRWQPDQSLVKVLGADGKVTYQPRSKSVGQAAPDEAMIVMGPDGKPLYARGGAASVSQMSGALSQKSQTDVEKDLLDMTAQSQQVQRIARSFKPEYQQIGTRWDNLVASVKDKTVGLDPNSPTAKALGEFTSYRADASQFFADRLKAMSGAAVTEGEAKRQEAYLPTPGTGLTDGDSPLQLKTKVDRMQDFFNNATARLHYVQRNGLSIDKVPLDKMPQVIRDRGGELQRELTNRGLQGDELKAAVSQQLAREFGLLR